MEPGALSALGHQWVSIRLSPTIGPGSFGGDALPSQGIRDATVKKAFGGIGPVEPAYGMQHGCDHPDLVGRAGLIGIQDPRDAAVAECLPRAGHYRFNRCANTGYKCGKSTLHTCCCYVVNNTPN